MRLTHAGQTPDRPPAWPLHLNFPHSRHFCTARSRHPRESQSSALHRSPQAEQCCTWRSGAPGIAEDTTAPEWQFGQGLFI